MADKIATRQAYGEALIELVEKNDKVVVLDADLANATQTCKVAKAHPEKFYNFGIAEANMVDAAAGMSTMGLVPFCSTFAMFAAGRAYEQIRNSVAYPHFNVKICATHAGVSVGEDGGSHQCIEDLALMRVIPGMTVLCPADANEAKAATMAIADFDGPVYMRLARLATPVFEGDMVKPFVLGKANVLREGKDVAIFATGLMVNESLMAAEALAKDGIDAAVIERLAVQFAQAAPAASIEASWRAAFGCAYANSGETARALCLFNTLLGCWNQKGGALLPPSFGSGELDPVKFPAVPAPAAPILGSEEYPLALSNMGSNTYAAQLAHDGRIKGMFFYNSNMAAGYANPAYLAEALGKLELMVVCDVQMSETALLADYVLPECVYLERMELPEFIAGKVPAVTLRDQVLERPEGAKSVDEIFTELAEACGVGQYFQFTLEELAEAELATVGLSLGALRQAGGTVNFPEKAFKAGTAPVFNTPTGKVQFCSDACAAAGLSPCPVWVEPAVMPNEQAGELRLIGGKQPNMSHTMTANIPELMNITEDYELTRVWLSAQDAAAAGVEDGDEIIVSNDTYEGHAFAKVTQRLRPGVLFMPSHYGASSPELHTANGVGLRIMDFVPMQIEPAYGSAMTQEAVVTIMKVGA